MISDLKFDFLVNEENKTVTVNREFAANLDLMWDAWTKPEILDQWWAPKPWKAETKKMDFRVGGFWHYAMVGPEGERHYGRADYKSITPKKEFIAIDGFCDENGVISKELPRNNWETSFGERNGTTTVNVKMTFASREDLEKTIEMGFKEGFTTALNGLDELLTVLKK